MRSKTSNTTSAATKAVLALAALLHAALPGPCASQTQRHAASEKPAITASEQHRLNEQLQDAVNLGNVRQVRELLARGADANTRCQQGDFPNSPVLLEAAALGNAPVVWALLGHGARVNVRGFSCTAGAPRGEGNYRDSTALIEACLRDDNEDTIRILLAHGADVNARDRSGTTALSASVWKAQWSEAKLLLNYGARASRWVRREISSH